MAAPQVIMREVDLSTRVPSFPGVYGAMVLAANKGPINVPTLVTSESQLLRLFTPDERVEVGYDLGYYSALAYLQGSNKLWIVRPNTSQLSGGLVIKTAASTGVNAAITGALDPTVRAFANDEAFILYGANGGLWNNNISIKLYNDKTPEVTVDATSVTSNQMTVSGVWETGFPVLVAPASTGTLPGGLAANTTYYAIKSAAGKIKFATSEANAQAGTGITLTAGTGLMKLMPYKDFVKESDAMYLEVYKTYSGDTSLVESFLISRTPGKKDGRGQNIFLEDVLQGSNFIRGFSNPLVATGTACLGQNIRLSLAGGTNGTAGVNGTGVLESNMITSADQLSNTESIPVTLLMDAGFASSGYQLKLITIAESRKDCIALLSTPYANEASASYLNDIVDYRKSTLNVSTSFAGLFTPHCKIYDKFSDRTLYVAPDGYAGAAISKTASNQEIWYPAAGFRRGMLLVNDLRRRFTTGEMDYLYDSGINPLRFAPGRGILIWGQKTLLSRPSALDRINVRCMLIVIEPAIKVALEDFLFEINDSPTRSMAVTMIESYLEGIKARKGLYDFRVVCDDSNNLSTDVDNHRMNVAVFVKPTIDVEEIPCTVVITPTGMDFSLAASVIF